MICRSLPLIIFYLNPIFVQYLYLLLMHFYTLNSSYIQNLIHPLMLMPMAISIGILTKIILILLVDMIH